MVQIQMKYNIIQCLKILNKIIINNCCQPKYFFFENLKKIQYISKIGQIFFTLQTSLYRLFAKTFLKKLQEIKNNGYHRYNLGKKFFNYESSKFNYELNYGKEDLNNENAMNQKALFFYYRNLKKKIFMLFKFNLFCNNKKANKYLFNKNNKNNTGDKDDNNNNNENDNCENNSIQKYLNNDNLLNSNAYKFFHGNEDNKKEETENEQYKNLKNDKILNYNNSVEINIIYLTPNKVTKQYISSNSFCLVIDPSV